jgi:hypothetical protein
MDEIKDPLLEAIEVSDQRHETGFSSLKKRELNIVGGFLEVIRRVKGVRGKKVPIDLIIENTRKLFSGDLIKAEDALWIQHCSSSLRELLDDIRIPDDMICALKCLPKNVQDDGSLTQEYQRIKKFQDFFNDIVHFKDGSSLENAKAIVGNNSLQNVNAEIFETICSKFFQELYSFFEAYCMKPNRPSI